MRRSARASLVRLAVGAALTVLAASCQQPVTGAGSGGVSGSIPVDPCATSSALACDLFQVNLAYPPQGTPRHQLAIVLNGAGAQPLAYTKLSSSLQAAGFSVAAVRYSSAVSTTAACPDANAVAAPDCQRAVRSEITFGANVADPTGHAYDSSAVAVSQASSLVNRTLRLVDYLASHYPTDGWSDYQARSGGVCTSVDPAYGVCDLDWSKVVLVGHSLGAGEALYLSKFHPVARVVLLSGPFDEYTVSGTITVAPWITEGGFATPTSSIFGLTNTVEPNFAATSAAWNALGLVGPQVSVDGALAPYGGSQQLTTSLTPACSVWGSSHDSTGQDLCVNGSPPKLTMAWQFMAGA